jgi:hypothetical protein
MIKGISHLMLRGIAFYIMEPKFRRGGRIRPQAVERLKPALKELNAAYEDARQFFVRVDMCRTCAVGCCGGDFNRYTVFDHISHVVAKVKEPLEWGYRLYPFSSYSRNKREDGWCRGFVQGKGCGIAYSLRPAICVWGICERMDAELDTSRKAFLDELRRRIDRVHWDYVRILVFGGIQADG